MADDAEPNEAEVSDAMSEYDDQEAHFKDEDDKMADHSMSLETGQDGASDVKKKYDPKDPLRPRRKKARRACYACQRAHLTCGDERPCQRCIKRGLAEQCQDGVRKKAKYLHDAPPEALGPVLGPNFNAHSHQSRPNTHRQPSSVASEASSNATTTAFFSQPSAAPSYGVFSPAQQSQVASLPEGMTFSSQQSPVSPTFQGTANSQLGGLTVPQVSGDITNFSPAFFDPSNPAIFNFNLEGLNFGSQYGAMEFSMLGHMSSGAAETPPRDPSISQAGAGDITFGPAIFNGVGFDKIYDANVMGDFVGLEQSSNGPYSQGNLQHGLPHAYAIAAGPSSLQSPSTENNSPQPTATGFDGSPTTVNYANSAGGNSAPHAVGPAPPSRPKAKSVAAARFGPQSTMGKRHRDSSLIYETVTEPYMYVRGFHRLIALLQKRLSASKILRVAKSLASIRPSFIACTRTLSRADLVFMEKSFQRTLFEFGEFLDQTSSPTVLCRRTGEVVAVNKEFTALTGWRKDVLLGKEPNLNVNTGNPGNSNSDPAAGSNSFGRTGLSTPRLKSLSAFQAKLGVGSDTSQTAAVAAAAQPLDSGPQPLFIAELMDDDSVIQFYEDFAQLAFENSRGKVIRKGRLFKYRTRSDAGAEAAASKPEQQHSSPQKDLRQSILSNRVARIDGEHGISKIERDGKLECSYCWHIRRDTFDIPMMIVMNFLPCYYPNQEPHQLAV